MYCKAKTRKNVLFPRFLSVHKKKRGVYKEFIENTLHTW